MFLLRNTKSNYEAVHFQPQMCKLVKSLVSGRTFEDCKQTANKKQVLNHWWNNLLSYQKFLNLSILDKTFTVSAQHSLSFMSFSNGTPCRPHLLFL